MGWYPSSQRGRAVNAVALPSGVQIPPSPHFLRLRKKIVYRLSLIVYSECEIWILICYQLFTINYLLNFRFVKIYRPGSSEAEQLHGKE